jgi:hypothetical protein
VPRIFGIDSQLPDPRTFHGLRPNFTMTTDDSARDENPSAASEIVIAVALENQLSLVSSSEKWLTQRTEVDGELNGIVARVQGRLDSYRQWLLQAQHTPYSVPEDTDPWLMDARLRSGSDDGSVIVVTGPGVGEPIEMTPDDEKQLEYLISVCSDCRNRNMLGWLIRFSFHRTTAWAT